MRLILFLLFLLFVLPVNSQISGIVIDAKTNKPIPYASIVTNNKIGTITNDEGLFDLNIICKDTMITISCLSYKTKTIKITNKSRLIIKLNEDVFLLNEAIVSDFSDKTISKIILLAKNKILKQKQIKTKTFVKMQSIKNTSKIVELYEGFYSSEINNAIINKITFKNAIFKTIDDGRYIQSLDFCSYLPLNTYIFYKPETFNKQDITEYKNAYFVNKSSKQTNFIIIESPFSNNSRKSIVNNYYLNMSFIKNKVVKINYKLKKDTLQFGYFIINLDNNNILEFSFTQSYDKNLPVSIVNKDYSINDLTITYNVKFNTTVPYVMKYDLEYTYNNINTTDTINTELIYYNYKTDSFFSNPHYNLKTKIFPIDYNLLSITPLNKNLWLNENVLKRSKKEEKFLINQKVNHLKSKDFGIVMWNTDKNIDTSMVKKIKSNKYLYNIETVLSYDYYKYKDTVYITTSALIDYNKTYFSFQPYGKIIKIIYDLTKNYSLILKKELIKDNNPNNFDKIYKKVYDKFTNEKNKYELTYNKYNGLL